MSLPQIKNRCPQLPVFEPDSSKPIFGKNEGEDDVGKAKERPELHEASDGGRC